MKKAVRLIALLMALLMVLGTLAACTPAANKTEGPKTEDTKAPGTGNTNPDKTGEAQLSEMIQEAIADKRFSGENIGIVVSGGSFATRSIAVDKEADDYDPNYSVNVAVEKRNLIIQEALGVTITPEETVGMQGMVTYMREHFSAPTVDLDIVGVYQYFDIGLAFGENVGSFYNYNNLTEDGKNYLNLDAPYWDKATYDTLEWEGAAFWVTGDLSQMWLSSQFVSYVNANIWKNYADKIEEKTGYSDIYELVYAGKWTLDLILWLNDIVYVNNDGDESKVSLQDQHGFLSYTAATGINSIVVDALFSGCNITWTKIDSEGKPSISFYNNNLKAYGEKTTALYNTSKSCLIDYNSSTGNQVVNRFADGNTLVTLNILSDAETYLGDMEDDYYILPLPKLDEKQKNYATTLGDGVTQFGIPTTNANPAAATATLELLGYYSYEEVTPVYYGEVLKGRYVRGDSDEAGKMIDFIRTTIYSDLALIWSNSIASYGATSSLSWFLRDNIGAKNMATQAIAKQKTWQTGLDKLLIDLEMASESQM